MNARWTRPELGGMAQAAALAGLLVFFGGLALRSVGPTLSPSGQSSLAPGVGASPSSPASASPASTAAPSLGPIADGIPATIDGEPVLRSEAVAARIASSADAGSFLVGGWFHAGRPAIFCPAYLAGTPWWLCSAFTLYDQPQGSAPLWIYPGDPIRIDPGVPFAATRAAVLRIHTHDPSCPGDLQGCSALPVLVELVWLGAAG